MKTLPIKTGIVFQGKLIPWSVFNEVLCGAADQRTTDKINKKIQDLISFTPILINQNTNNKEIAEILGVKITENELTLKRNILKKVEKFENNS